MTGPRGNGEPARAASRGSSPAASPGAPPASSPGGGSRSPAPPAASPVQAGARLRLARQARGLSQQQLAGMAGVSRQALSAVEAGHSDPSLRVALALARALGESVEELFGPGALPAAVAARPVAPVGGPGARVVLAPVGEGFVALPLAGDTAMSAGFLPAGGLAADSLAASGGAARDRSAAAVQPLAPPRPTLVVAGCDPALPLLARPLALLDPPVSFAWWPCGSEEALRLAGAGLVHAAGAHLRDHSGEYNTRAAGRRLAGQGAEVVGFTSWREGLALRPSPAGAEPDLAEAAGRGLRLVNREEGSEARRVLDREAARLGLDPGSIEGYGTRASGHLQVASAVAARLADVGVASEPAALAYGLAFAPLADERFDLVIPGRQAGSREVQALLKVLTSPWLLAQLATLPGYDPCRCGEHVASL